MGRKAELKQMRVEEREADGRDPRGEYPACGPAGVSVWNVAPIIKAQVEVNARCTGPVRLKTIKRHTVARMLLFWLRAAGRRKSLLKFLVGRLR